MYSEYYLEHHGIKGMKWGVRRYQNKDGSYTSAGRKRYDIGVEKARGNLNTARANYKKATKDYNKATSYGMLYNKKATENLKRSGRELEFAKEDFKNAKVQSKLSQETSKSKHRLALEEHYKSKGMNAEEAAIAAYKRDRTEKMLLAAAGVTAAAATAYVAKRQYDLTVDKVIKKGTIIKRVSDSETASVHDGFYAAFGKHDPDKYIANFGQNQEGNNKYQKTLEITDDIKIASERHATGSLKKLIVNDPSLKNDIESQIGEYKKLSIYLMPKQNKMIKKASQSLAKGKIDRNVYRFINFANDRNFDTGNELRASLRNEGYDAIGDINDQFLSGYDAKTANIFLSGKKVVAKTVRKLTDQDIEASKNRILAREVKKEASKVLAKNALVAAGASAASAGASKSYNSYKRNKIVSDYKKQHPNTNLSYNDIVRNYYKSR